MITEDNNKIKIVDYLPYVGSLIVFLGVCRLSFFYNAFNVNIVPFLEFSEILTSFLDLLMLFIIMITVSLIQNFLIDMQVDDETRAARIKKVNEQNSFFKRLRYYFYLLFELLFGLFLMVVGICAAKFFFGANIALKDIIRMIGLFSLMICYVVIQHEIALKHNRKESTVRQRNITSICMYMILCIGVVLLYARFQSDQIKTEKSYTGTTLLFTDAPTFVSSPTDYYIGKTQKYVFVYHELSKTTDVIPVERIRQIIFKKK